MALVVLLKGINVGGHRTFRPSVLAKALRRFDVVNNLPSSAAWSLRILSRHDRFVVGLYRREMKAITYLGHLDKVFGVPVTTRNWRTVLKLGGLARALQ